MKQTNALRGTIKGNMIRYDITMEELAGVTGKDKSTLYRQIRDGNIKYSDLKIIANHLNFTPEQKAAIL